MEFKGQSVANRDEDVDWTENTIPVKHTSKSMARLQSVNIQAAKYKSLAKFQFEDDKAKDEKDDDQGGDDQSDNISINLNKCENVFLFFINKFFRKVLQARHIKKEEKLAQKNSKLENVRMV